ncbi:MAG: helix-turn-helix transcriptional regulator [Pirellulales bacterium]|nr:helix-turn-helix transcriptional regulator [Pirellulales bacterium]
MARTKHSSKKHAGGPESNDASFQDPRSNLHRIGVARQQQGISLRTVARRMQKTVAEVRDQELSSTDLNLSTVYNWCEALNLPVEELLVEPSEGFSTPILKRTQLINLMKMALTIGQAAKDDAIRRLAEAMVDQMVDLMPELGQIRSALGSTGMACRGRMGRIAENVIPDTFFDSDHSSRY